MTRNDLAKRRWSIGVAVLMAGAFSVLVWLNVARYRAYSARSTDLANMSQAIWSATQGEPLVMTTEGVSVSRLGQHMEIIYFLIAPLYALWSSPMLLLILQSALCALGALPVFVLARRRLQSLGLALALVAVYLLFPVALTAGLFEFHADTLAMPLLLLAIEAQDRQAWPAYALWVLLALASKVYVAAAVLLLGVVLFLKGKRRAGAATLLVAVLWALVAFFGVRSWFASDVENALVKGDTVDYFSYYFGQLWQLDDTLTLRLVNGLVVFLPALLLGRRALLWLGAGFLMALPVLVSSGPGPVFSYEYHHYALVVPFLITAIVYGAEKLQQQAMKEGGSLGAARPAVLFTLVVTLLINMTVVDWPLSPRFYLTSEGSRRGLTKSGYGVTARDRFKDAWLAAHVPASAPLLSSRELAAHLTNRTTLYLTDPEYASLAVLLPKTDFAVVDLLNESALRRGSNVIGGVGADLPAVAQILREPGWRVTTAQDGLMLFARGDEELLQSATAREGAAPAPSQAQFGDAVGLVSAGVEPLGARSFRLTWQWVGLPGLTNYPRLMAVSRVEGIPFSRTVHLPTWALLPTEQWQPGTVVEEQFDIVLPQTPPGSYRLLVGWYDTTSLYAAETDARSRVGDEVQALVLEVEEP